MRMVHSDMRVDDKGRILLPTGAKLQILIEHDDSGKDPLYIEMVHVISDALEQAFPGLQVLRNRFARPPNVSGHDQAGLGGIRPFFIIGIHAGLTPSLSEALAIRSVWKNFGSNVGASLFSPPLCSALVSESRNE